MSRRVIALVVLVVLFVTVAWYFFLISPKNEKIADLQNQTDTAVAEEQALRVAIATLEAVQQNDVAYLAAIGQMEAGIPEQAELAVFIEEVTTLAAESGVSLQSIAPAEPTDPTGLELYEISVSMNLEGEYFEVLGFLFGLDDMERIVVVESIAITASGGGGGDEEIPDETTTTTVPATTTTTTVAGATTSSTSSTTTTTTTTLPPTTTTIPAIEENLLSVSITVKLFTRTPLLPIVVIGDEGAQADETGPPTEGDAGGDFGQSEFGIDGEDAPADAEGTP